MPRDTAVLSPNLGLYLGRSPLTVPARGLSDGMNFRIDEGRLTNISLGWVKYSQINFQAPVTLIDTFFIRGGQQRQIIGTTRDLFNYSPESDTAEYINPIYNVGTVDVTAEDVTIDTGTPDWLDEGVKPGDFISFGADDETDPGATWYEIDDVTNTTLTLTGVGVPTPLAAQEYTIRRTFTGEVNSVWSTATFVAPDDGTGDDLWFATNGVDYVVTWDGNAAQVVSRSSLGFKCREINVYKNMMIYANISTDGGDELPTTFYNSDIQKPLEIALGLAGVFRAHSGVDAILALRNLGDNLAIYSEFTITIIQFIGDPLIFVFRDVSNGVGLIAQRLVANFGDYHEFLSTDSQYLFDGATINEVGKQVWREVLNRRDQLRKPLGHTHFSEERGELHWTVPLTSDVGNGDETAAADTGYVEHYLEEVGDRVPTPYSRREGPWLCSGYGVTAGALTFDEVNEAWEDVAFRWNDATLFAAFPISLMGSGDGYVYTINGAQSADGVPLVSWVNTNRRALGDGRMRGLLKRVYPFMEDTSATLDVTVRLSDHAEGPITTTDTEVFDTSLPEGGHFVSPFRRGRYFELRFGNNGDPWTMSGYDTDVTAGGFR